MGYKIQQGQIEGLLEEFDEIRSEIVQTGQNLSVLLFNTGDTLEDKIADLTGDLEYTGSILQTQVTSLTTNLNLTGSGLNSKINTLSGNLIATGQYLYPLITGKVDINGGYVNKTYIPQSVTDTWNGQLASLAGDDRELEYIFTTIDDITSLGADNLGNHRATGNLNMAGYNITGATTISGRDFSGSGAALLVSTGTWNNNLLGIAGNIQAALDAIDNFSLGGGGDNLGNHTATGNLNMAGKNITGATGISGLLFTGFSGDFTRVSSQIIKTAVLTSDSYISIPVSIEMGGNIDLATNGISNSSYLTTTHLAAETIGLPLSEGAPVESGYYNWLSGKNIYGSGSSIKVNTGTFGGNLLGAEGTLTGLFEKIDSLTLTDNLGNHTATQTLNLNGFNITGVNGFTGNNITGTRFTGVNGLFTNLSGDITRTRYLYVDDTAYLQNLDVTLYSAMGEVDVDTINGIGIFAERITGDYITGTQGQFNALDVALDLNVGGTAAVENLVANSSVTTSDLQVNNGAIINGTTQLETVTNLGMLNTYADPVNTGYFNVLSGESIVGTGSSIRVATGTFGGNLLGAEGTLTGLFEKIDSLTLGTPGALTSQDVNVPFNYMNLSKCFTTGLIGWATEEEDVTYLYSAGGYESANTGTMYSGTAWIDLPIPRTATGFRTTGNLEYTLVANNTSQANCKIDLFYYTSSGNYTQNTLRYQTTGVTLTTANVPQLYTINAADLLNTSLSGHTRAKLKWEWYSKSGCSVKLIAGNLGFVS